MELEIIHLDMDAFYASVEQRDNPKLRGKPVIIGGKSKRGVVSTASYEARTYGIHSAMPIFKARKLCPKGVYIRPNHKKYKEVSVKIRKIFYRYTDLVEPLSLDEAYLDVSGAEKNSIQIAKRIKREIKDELDLTVSVGVSYNKYLAKLASDLNKPDGFKIISPFEAKELIFPMDVNQLWGVGAKMEEKLKSLGFERIEDVARADKRFLIRKLGKMGYQLYNLANGHDPREVTPPTQPKSIGKETTFRVDIKDKNELKKHLKKLSQQVALRVKKKKVKGKTVTLKIKYEDFEELSRSKTVHYYIEAEEEIYQLAEKLLLNLKLSKKVRLIGVTLSNLNDEEFEQLRLFEYNSKEIKKEMISYVKKISIKD